MRNQHFNLEIPTRPISDKIDFLSLCIPASCLLIRPRHIKLELDKRRAPFGLFDAGNIVGFDLAGRELLAQDSLRMLGNVGDSPGVQFFEEFGQLLVGAKTIFWRSAESSLSWFPGWNSAWAGSSKVCANRSPLCKTILAFPPRVLTTIFWRARAMVVFSYAEMRGGGE